MSERELICELAGVAPGHAQSEWGDIPFDEARRLYVALRTVAELGREATYALGYSRSSAT